MLEGPWNADSDKVAAPPASARSTSWKGSNSFLAANIWMPSPVAVGGDASRSTLSMVVAVQIDAPAGAGRE
jgi:hypothetical protein